MTDRTVDRRTLLKAAGAGAVGLVGVATIYRSGDSIAPDPDDYEATLAAMDGDGSAADPHVVTDIEELQAIDGDLSAHYELGTDVDAGVTEAWNDGRGFDPIGDWSREEAFAGRFDGEGNEISGLHVSREADSTGLFAGSTGEIRNVSLADATVDGGTATGGLVGVNGGTVRGSSVAGSVTGADRVGGLVGTSRGDVIEAAATGSVTGANGVGGLVGTVTAGAIRASTATGEVRGESAAGGLVGANGGTIGDSAATTTVTCGDYAGGLVGINGGTLQKSAASGDVIGKGEPDKVGPTDAGGIAGRNDDGTIDECAADVGVVGNDMVGGLVGVNRGEIARSHARGNVRSETSSPGGLVASNNGVVRKSFAIGAVNGYSHEGGLVGMGDGEVESSYWDADATGQDTSVGGTGLTTDEMQGEAAPANMSGFDFESVWETVVDPDDYPALRDVDLRSHR